MYNSISLLIAKHIREFYFGGNWTSSNLKASLSGLTWQEVTRKIENFNTIADLTYHIHYYTRAILPVLKGGELKASDKFSFDTPPIQSQQDWDNFLDTIWAEAEEFVQRVETLDDTILKTFFTQEKYGNYYRNLHGFVEHGHYHLGQIVLVRKLILTEKKQP